MCFAGETTGMNENVPTEKIEELAKLILDYLRNNPEAGDTLEGITRWWIDAQMIEISTKEVSQALDFLLQRKLIEARRDSGSLPIYRISTQS